MTRGMLCEEYLNHIATHSNLRDTDQFPFFPRTKRHHANLPIRTHYLLEMKPYVNSCWLIIELIAVLFFFFKKKAFNNQGIEKSPSLPPSPDEIPREPPESPFPKALKNCMKGKAEIRLCFNVRNVGVLKQ